MGKDFLRVGADPFPPYQYQGQDGRVAGSDCERVTALLKQAGYEARVTLDAWDTLERMLAAGELDALFQVQKTAKREQTYFFSDLLRNAVTEVITASTGLELAGWETLCQGSLTLGVIDGYAYGEAVDLLPARCKRPYTSQEALLEAAAAGSVDLAVFDRGVREHLCGRLGIGPLYPLEELTFLRPLYILFREPEPAARVRAVQRTANE